MPGWSAFPPLLILHRLAFSGSSAVVVLRSLPFSGNYRFRLWSRVAFAHAVKVTRTAGGHKPSNRTCTAQHISSYDSFEPWVPRAVVRQKLSLFLDFCVKIRPTALCMRRHEVNCQGGLQSQANLNKPHRKVRHRS